MVLVDFHTREVLSSHALVLSFSSYRVLSPAASPFISLSLSLFFCPLPSPYRFLPVLLVKAWSGSVPPQLLRFRHILMMDLSMLLF